jgi:acetoin utilization deacetylase AcuC-like enzyme
MVKVVYHPDCTQVYTADPAAEPGRIEAIVEALRGRVDWVEPQPATPGQIALAHTPAHIERVKARGLYPIAALAAGGALEAARIGLQEPAFALIRPPGHHASADHSWGFCYFNNMAVALMVLKDEGRINRALVLDIDLHFGDGTVHILGQRTWVDIFNFSARRREDYLSGVQKTLAGAEADLIGISAGFDYHRDDWGGLLATEDYETIGRLTRLAAQECGGGCFAILEGGYNHQVLGQNTAALLAGLSD